MVSFAGIKNLFKTGGKSVARTAKQSKDAAISFARKNPKATAGILAGSTGGAIILNKMATEGLTLEQALIDAPLDIFDAIADRSTDSISNVASNILGEGFSKEFLLPIALGIVAFIIFIFVLKKLIG